MQDFTIYLLRMLRTKKEKVRKCVYYSYPMIQNDCNFLSSINCQSIYLFIGLIPPLMSYYKGLIMKSFDFFVLTRLKVYSRNSSL